MSTPSIEDVQQFLAHEAHLLDSWQLAEWAELFTDDGEYLVPPPGEPEGDPAQTLFFVYDDRNRLRERAIRLLKTSAHAEFPRSTTTRLTSNVRLGVAQDGDLKVECTFVVYRARAGKFDVLPGHCRYVMTARGGTPMRIRSKRAMLGIDALRPQDKLTIIL
jgi:p-cumate 2,3-dioxygenase beta subunit